MNIVASSPEGLEKVLAKEAGLSTVKVLWGFLSGLCEKHNIQA